MFCEGPIRFFLNFVRLSTICMLVMVAVTQLIETSQQSKHTQVWVNDLSGTNNYVDGYDTPTHFFGPVWSLFSHLAIFVQCFILVVAEIRDNVYDNHIPLIGSNYGLLFPSLWQFSLVFTGLSHHHYRKSALVSLYALAILACINLLLGLVGIRVKHARSLCTVEAWCSVLPPPFSWIVQMISKCTQSRRVSQEMRDKTRWSFLSASAASDNSTSRKGSIVKTMEKVYDRYSMRNEPFRSSETPLPRYSDEKHNHSREDSAEKASLSSKRSVKFSERPSSVIPS
ncbi:hypothetical protein E3Q18_00824 [Wallemia mellicola]|nr:hypothetical protein E3Q21_00205 [Wallemia mellicola]TIB92214.1 hypothetical protein E3Q20_00475 [Wallemia mellicola]TIC01169.1 hypothetical protein E3Q18_00824 [Wallemia mellicola]TIC14192.1 hypothetical protein E3Q14_00902 [Wallemia mellicola]TIC43789.1 hypothetical protein E3Q07_00382 [Wallemia mellicola]